MEYSSIMGLSIQQQKALALMPKITGIASAISSIFVASIVLKKPKKRSKVYHRLILGMSIADISSSLWLSLSTWPIPAESNIMWSIGNTTTCNIQGFFTQFGISSPIYNLSLSIYYLLVIRYSYKESDLKSIEIYFHLLPLLWASATAIAGLFLNLYHSANLWCFIAPNNSTTTEPTNNYNMFRWIFFYAPLWISIFCVTINLILVFLHVRTITLKSEKHLSRIIRPSIVVAAARIAGQATGEVGEDEDESGNDISETHQHESNNTSIGENHQHNQNQPQHQHYHQHKNQQQQEEQHPQQHPQQQQQQQQTKNQDDTEEEVEEEHEDDEEEDDEDEDEEILLEDEDEQDDDYYYEEDEEDEEQQQQIMPQADDVDDDDDEGDTDENDVDVDVEVEVRNSTTNTSNNTEEAIINTTSETANTTTTTKTTFFFGGIVHHQQQGNNVIKSNNNNKKKMKKKIRRNPNPNQLSFSRRRRQVAYQCLRYALVLYFTWLPLTVVRIMQTIGRRPPIYAFLLLAAITTPMQGLPNFVVYLYPTYKSKLKKKRRRKKQKQQKILLLQQQQQEQQQQNMALLSSSPVINNNNRQNQQHIQQNSMSSSEITNNGSHYLISGPLLPRVSGGSSTISNAGAGD